MKHLVLAAVMVAAFASQAMAYSSGLSWGFNVSVGNPVPPSPPQVYVRPYYQPAPPVVVVAPPPPPPVYVYDYKYPHRHKYKHRHNPHYYGY